MSLSVRRYELPLVAATRLGPARLATRAGLVVELRGQGGLVGRGEAAPAYWIDGTDMHALTVELQRFAGSPSGQALDDSSLVLAELKEWGQLTPPARCAIDSAVLDLRAQLQGKSVAELLGGPESITLEVSALLGGDTPEAVHAQAVNLCERGYRVLKLKVGGVAADHDIARIRAAHAAMGDRGTLRLDANGAWLGHEAVAVLGACKDAPIELVEEPLCVPSPETIAHLREKTGLPLAMDESIVSAEDLQRFADSCDAVVLKLARVGGPSAALLLARQARDQGLRVVFTDSIETAIGRRATLHVAAAAAEPRAAVGLGGAVLLAKDLVDDPDDAAARVVVHGPGLGLGTPSL